MSTTAPTEFQMPAPSAEHLATQKVGERLAELCSAGKNIDAIKELYADNARHIEAMEGPGCPRITSGKSQILAKADEFEKATTVHGATCGNPIVNGDQFLCAMSLDCTSSIGPMAGQRMQISEQSLYTVRDGRIVEAKFFYSCGG